MQGQLGYTMFFVRSGILEVRVALDLPKYLEALATVQSVRGMRTNNMTGDFSQADEDDPDSWVAAIVRWFRSSKVVLHSLPPAFPTITFRLGKLWCTSRCHRCDRTAIHCVVV